MAYRWKVLILYSVGAFMAFLDAPVVTVAFPALAADFQGSPPETLAWVLDAYFIAFASLLVMAGALADRYGRRRVFITGLWLFTVASVLCAVASTVGFLIVARALQAIGGALVVPAGLGMMLQAFPPEKRKEAIGINAAIVGLAIAASPALGGVVVDGLSWRWLFYLSAIIVLVTVVWAHRALDADDPVKEGAPLPDFLGGALQAAGVSLVVLAVLKRQDWGTTDLRTIGAMGLGLAATVHVFFRAPAKRAPVVDRELFANKTFSIANVAAFVFSIGFFATTISSVLFMTSVWGYSILQAGAAFAPGAVVAAIAGGPAGILAERYGSRVVSVVGCLLAAAGLALIAVTTTAEPNFVGTWLPGQLVYSVGVVAATTGLVGAALAAAPPVKFALASGTNAAVRQVGGAVGVAISLATVTAVGVAALDQSHTAFWIAVGAMAAGGVVAMLDRSVQTVAVAAPVPAGASSTQRVAS